MIEPLHVLFTMDVELAATGPGVSGPRSDAEGAAAIRSYNALLRRHGFVPTYFVHPEVAEAQPALFRELRDAGCGIGLHVHAVKFQAVPHDVELGGLAAAEQREVLTVASDMLERALGERPTLFRPGCFSANDATFGVLVDLGFIGGGVSIPGRIWPERHCVWSGAHPYAHRAHASFRQCPGDLPFVNVPLSVDFAAGLLDHPVGFQHYPDLRPGGVYTEDEDGRPRDHATMLRDILRRMHADDPPVKTLVIDVHNDRDFEGDTQAAAHLRTLLDRIGPEARELGWTAAGATMRQVVEACNAAGV